MSEAKAEAMQRVINENWHVEGDTVAARAASIYRMSAAPISAIASVKREIDKLDPATGARFWASHRGTKNPVLESQIVAEIARIEQALGAAK